METVAAVVSSVAAVVAVIFSVLTTSRAEKRADAAEQETRLSAERAEAAVVSVERVNLVGYRITNGSGLPIYSARVYAWTPGNPIHATTTEPVIQPGANVMPDLPDRRGGANAAANHAVMFRNHEDHWWAWFAGVGPERLPDDEKSARATVEEKLAATYEAFVQRGLAQLG